MVLLTYIDKLKNDEKIENHDSYHESWYDSSQFTFICMHLSIPKNGIERVFCQLLIILIILLHYFISNFIISLSFVGIFSKFISLNFASIMKRNDKSKMQIICSAFDFIFFSDFPWIFFWNSLDNGLGYTKKTALAIFFFAIFLLFLKWSF